MEFERTIAKMQLEAQKLETQKHDTNLTPLEPLTIASKPRSSKEDKYPKCDLCSSPMPSNVTSINLSQVCGMADWHFEIYPIFHVCPKCRKEFKEYVEKWFEKKGAAKKPYFK